MINYAIKDAIEILKEVENFCNTQILKGCKHCPFFKGYLEETTANGKERFVLCINEDFTIAETIRNLREYTEEKE